MVSSREDAEGTKTRSFATDVPPSTPRGCRGRRGGGGFGARRSREKANKGSRRAECDRWKRPSKSVASLLKGSETQKSSSSSSLSIPQLPLHHLANNDGSSRFSDVTSMRRYVDATSREGIVSLSARSAGSHSSATSCPIVSSPSTTPRSSPRSNARLRTPGRVSSPETGKRCINRWRALEDSGDWPEEVLCRGYAIESVVRRDFEEAVIQCDRCFVEPMQWMGALHESSGDLRCPNERCRARLGTWDWHGARCTCGVFVKPSFAVEKNCLYSRERPLTARGDGRRRKRP